MTNGFAAEHEVILLNNAGVGGSTGETPPAVAAMTKSCVDFCRAVDVNRLDVVGFSLGGMIAQQLAFEYPDMIRRMILLGTGPRGGEGMTFRELSLDELKDPVALITKSFFTPSQNSQCPSREGPIRQVGEHPARNPYRAWKQRRRRHPDQRLSSEQHRLTPSWWCIQTLATELTRSTRKSSLSMHCDSWRPNDDQQRGEIFLLRTAGPMQRG